MLHHCVKLRLTLRRRRWGAGAAVARGTGLGGVRGGWGRQACRAPGRGVGPVLFHALKHGFLPPTPTLFFG